MGSSSSGSALSPRPAVFLDRDGTLNVDRGYTHRVEDLELAPGAAEAIARLNRADFLVIVVTNQSGVGRGYYDETAVARFHAAIEARLAKAGAHIDAFYFCPFHPHAAVARYRRASPLRKPDTGMFDLARADFPIDVARSWMIGDKLDDMHFARQAGLRGILVPTVGEGAPVASEVEALGFLSSPNLTDAVARILAVAHARTDH